MHKVVTFINTLARAFLMRDHPHKLDSRVSASGHVAALVRLQPPQEFNSVTPAHVTL